MLANELERQNKRLLAKLLAIVVMMGGVSYLMVPMYRQIDDFLENRARGFPGHFEFLGEVGDDLGFGQGFLGHHVLPFNLK